MSDIAQAAPVTAKVLLEALRRKFRDDALLAEVTLPDEEREAIHRAALVKHWPTYYEPRFKKQGLSYDAVVPDGYDVNVSISPRRIDALLFEGSQQRTAIEIKISRADFFRDTPEKRAPWQRVTNRFVYLTPANLMKPEEVPDGCGLWEYANGQITVKKKCRVQAPCEDFPQAMVRYFAWRAFAAEKKLAAQAKRPTSKFLDRRV